MFVHNSKSYFLSFSILPIPILLVLSSSSFEPFCSFLEKTHRTPSAGHQLSMGWPPLPRNPTKKKLQGMCQGTVTLKPPLDAGYHADASPKVIHTTGPMPVLWTPPSSPPRSLSKQHLDCSIGKRTEKQKAKQKNRKTETQKPKQKQKETGVGEKGWGGTHGGKNGLQCFRKNGGDRTFKVELCAKVRRVARVHDVPHFQISM